MNNDSEFIWSFNWIFLYPIQTGLFGHPWTGGGGGGEGVGVRRPFHFLKTIEDIDTNYASRDKSSATIIPQLWRHMASLRRHLWFLDFVKTLSKLIFSPQICWITSLDNSYSPFCQHSNETSTKNWNENTNGPIIAWEGLHNSVAMASG